MNEHHKMTLGKGSLVSLAVLTACVICSLVSCSSRMKQISVPFVEYADIQLEASCIATVARYERSDGETDWGIPVSVDTISYKFVLPLLSFPIDTCKERSDGKLYLSGFYVNVGHLSIIMSEDRSRIDTISAWLRFLRSMDSISDWESYRKIVLHGLQRSDPPNGLIYQECAKDIYHYAEKASMILDKNSIFMFDSTHYTIKRLPNNNLFAYKKEYVTPVRMLLDSNSYVRIILYNTAGAGRKRGIMEDMSVNSD